VRVGLVTAPEMTVEAVRERHEKLVKTDWLTAAQSYVKAKYDDGEVSLPQLLGMKLLIVFQFPYAL
jgi:hypothetical protein